jgi:hypothetical protein
VKKTSPSRQTRQFQETSKTLNTLKALDLQVRPIYHWKSDRIRAHVFLCMLAYYVEWHLRRALAEVLFDDQEREAAEATRKSIVAPVSSDNYFSRPPARKRPGRKSDRGARPRDFPCRVFNAC